MKRSRCGSCGRRLWVADPSCICGVRLDDGWKHAAWWKKLHPQHRGTAIFMMWMVVFAPGETIIKALLPGPERFRTPGNVAWGIWFILSGAAVGVLAHLPHLSRFPTKGQALQALFEFGWNAAVILGLLFILARMAGC